MHVRLRNDQTGAIKEVKVGFSWTLLFFSSFFGIPLFMRRFYQAAWPMFGLTAMELPQFFSDNPKFLDMADAGALIGAACAIYLGFRGNKLTAINLLQHGWSFLDEEDPATYSARAAWAIA